jgi:hypothetical protein
MREWLSRRRQNRRVRRVLAAALVGLTTFLLLRAPIPTISTYLTADPGSRPTLLGPCDGDGVGLAYSTAYAKGIGYAVASVIVSGLDPKCAGQTLAIELTDAGGSSLGGGTAEVPSSSMEVTVTVSGRVPAAAVEGQSVIIGQRFRHDQRDGAE